MNEIIKHADYAEIVVNSPKHGTVKLKIDLDDVDRVSKYHWSVSLYGRPPYKEINNKMYASNKEAGLLHRFIMKAPKGKMVDHKSRDTLDYRKFNLRVCTRSQNLMNRNFMINNKSGCVGVRWADDIPTPKWNAYIKVNQKRYHLGYFDDFDEAVDARKKAEEKYFGEYQSDYT